MKIIASIPVEKISGQGTFTFRAELREVEVIRVLRWAGEKNRRLNRFHYQADIKRHPDMHPEAICTGPNGLFRTNIVRRGLNPKWKPPEFVGGTDWADVEQEKGGA